MIRLTQTRLCAGLLAALVSLTAQGAAPEQQRALFQEVYQDLRLNRAVAEDKLAALRDYPLYPYIEYQQLRERLWRVDNAEMEAFLETNRDFPLAHWLRRDWLEVLAKRGRWRTFLEHYQAEEGAELACYQLQARKAVQGVNPDWLARAKELWSVGRSQPKSCDPVFAVLYQRDALSTADVWARIEAAMAERQHSLARYLAKRLPSGERAWVDHWVRMQRAPASRLGAPGFELGAARGQQILADGIRQLARRDADRAREFLARYEDEFAAETAAQVARYVALRAAYSRQPEALDWLYDLPEQVVDREVLRWRAKMARTTEDWPRLLEAISALPAADSNDPEWLYWRGHALVASGDTEQGSKVLRELAQERHYYGFLAADAIGEPYAFNAAPVQVDPTAVQGLAQLPALTRAHELRALGMMREARREWRAAVSPLPQDQQRAAAVLAAQWGWYDRAIFTANQAGLHDALELRFPTPFRDRVQHYSEQNRLDPALAYALMRKESAFMPDAVSPVGAMGLMQVMPRTGRSVAQRLNLPLSSSRALLDAETNMRLGSAYLRQVLDRFGGNPILAAAAYNAGPHRVEAWLKRNNGQPAAAWIENISFGETRDYVKSVLAFSVVFDWLLNGEARRMSHFMTQLNEDADVLHFRLAQELDLSGT